MGSTALQTCPSNVFTKSSWKSTTVTLLKMAGRGIAADVIERTRIVKDGQVHMANLAIIGGHSVNGVAKLHTELLKEDTLHDFYTIYPEKIQ